MSSNIFRQASWAVGVPICLWCTFLLMSIPPFFQRHFLYAHKVFPWWEDTNQPQIWGFAKNQVTPFHLTTDDGERIHAWHIMPLCIYQEHQAQLQSQVAGYCSDITAVESFRILKEDPQAQLVIVLHGNAGHIPTIVRSSTMHTLTDMTSYHVLAIDYRGFGKSSGVPTEEGLIRDASAAVEFALKTAGISPDRVVLLGHSLGSAVAVAVAERYATQHSVDFAGIVLVAGFSSLPTMLSHYAIAGCVPIFGPLRSWPHILQWILGFVVDRWASADRLASIMAAVYQTKGRHLRLSLIHAADDWHIPSYEDDKLFSAVMRPLLGSAGGMVNDAQIDAVKASRTVHLSTNAFTTEWREAYVVIRQERFPYGGHNGILTTAPVAMEVRRAFEEAPGIQGNK